MGKEKYQEDIRRLFEKSSVIDANSIKRIIGKSGRTKQYARHLLRNLIKKGKIRRLTKGYYTLYNEPSLIVFCFKPAYLGLQDAMSFHDLWEQETTPIVITTRKVRQGIRKVTGANVLIRRLDVKYFFGFDYFKQNDFYFPYSDIEKTFIDMVYFKEKLTKDAVENLRKKIDRKKLDGYLKIYPKKFKKKVKAFL